MYVQFVVYVCKAHCVYGACMYSLWCMYVKHIAFVVYGQNLRRADLGVFSRLYVCMYMYCCMYVCMCMYIIYIYI